MEKTATDVWKELVEAAKKVSEEQTEPDLPKVQDYGRRLDKYVELCSGSTYPKEKLEWLTVNEKYQMDPSFYRRRIEQIKALLGNRACESPSVTILCYRISERENCSPEDVCKTLIALGLFSKKTRVDKSIIGELRGDIGGKGNSNSEQIKEKTLNDQGAHDLAENSGDYEELPEDNAEDMGPQENGVDDVAELSAGDDKYEMDSIEEDARLNILQHTDQDNTLEITKKDLKRFVTGLIGAMSYKIKKRSKGERSSFYEVLTVDIHEVPVFHRGINTWKLVQVTYFASGTADEDIQQEIERLHGMEELPGAFVIIACATDGILRHVHENVACIRQYSIMLLCYEHQDRAYIYLKENPESDKKCFDYRKPDSPEYLYR